MTKKAPYKETARKGTEGGADLRGLFGWSDFELAGLSRANLLRALASAADDRETGETDRVLRQRVVDGIKDRPWANRPFNVIAKDRHADL